MTSNRTYRGLRRLDSFTERFDYLSLNGQVGGTTFGFERWMNQAFYQSRQWRTLRHDIIARDNGCDLGVPGYEVYDRVIIHHIIPMTVEDLEEGNPLCLDPDNLISTTHNTHNAIHFGDKSLLVSLPVERRSGDTKLW